MATGSVTRGGLLRAHPDFRRLWGGDAVSQVGTRISALAVPLVAVTTLRVSALEVALLTSVEALAFLVLGLPAGAWCDRVRRRPVLIATDLGRCAALGSVPVAAAFRALTIWQLYAVVLSCAALTVFFDVSHQSYLPALVGREQLVEANGKLEANRTVAAMAGPSAAGYLVQWLTGPLALAVDAASYAWSAAWIAAIRTREPVPRRAERSSLRGEIGEGLRFVWRHPALRAIAISGATAALFVSMQNAIIVVFLVREVGLAPGAIGVLFSVGSAGAIAGALFSARLTRRLGQRRALLTCKLCASVALLLVPLTASGWRVGLFAAGVAVAGFCIVAFNIVQVSFRQSLCPDRLLGRMNATMRVLLWGTGPVGAVLGGLLATSIGLRSTLWVSAAAGLLSPLGLLLSPLRRPNRWLPG